MFAPSQSGVIHDDGPPRSRRACLGDVRCDDPTQQLTMVDRTPQLYAPRKPQVVQLDWMHEPAVPAGSAAGKPYAAPATEKPAVPATKPNAGTPPAVKPAGGSAGAPPAASAPGPPSAQARDFATKAMPEVTAKCNSDRGECKK
jgi:hypothetical protein